MGLRSGWEWSPLVWRTLASGGGDKRGGRAQHLKVQPPAVNREWGKCLGDSVCWFRFSLESWVYKSPPVPSCLSFAKWRTQTLFIVYAATLFKKSPFCSASGSLPSILSSVLEMHHCSLNMLPTTQLHPLLDKHRSQFYGTSLYTKKELYCAANQQGGQDLDTGSSSLNTW